MRTVRVVKLFPQSPLRSPLVLYAVSSVSLYIVFEVLSHPDEASMSVLAFFYTLPLLPLLYFSRAVYRRRRDG